MERRVARMEDERTFVTSGSKLQLELEGQATKANRMLAVEGVTVAHSSNRLFEIEQFLIRPGDRVALLGLNGAGKTTFIESLVAAFAADAITPGIAFNPRCRLGYYDQ